MDVYSAMEALDREEELRTETLEQEYGRYRRLLRQLYRAEKQDPSMIRHVEDHLIYMEKCLGW